MMTFDKLLTFSTYSDNLTGVEQLRSISFAFFFRKLMCLLIDVVFFLKKLCLEVRYIFLRS